MERFPRHALRIDGPVLVALRVAARRILLGGGRDVGGGEALADVLELFPVLGLQAEVVDAFARRAIRDGEVDAWVL